MRKFFAYIFAAVCSLSCIKDKPTGADLAVGDRIPEFHVTMNDGSSVTDRQLCEGISVIVFFTTECPDCRETLPVVQEIYDDYHAKGVSFVLVSREEVDETIAEFWDSQGLTMPYSAQKDRHVYELFARTRVPRVYICKDGIIKAIFTDIPENPTYVQLKEALDANL